MALTHLNSIVFVGGEFSPEMFDERALFNGKMDRGGQLKVGPIGQFSYSSGTYRFEVAPPRLDLKHSGSNIIPDALVEAASTIATTIEPTRRAVSVSGFGMNCDTVFDRASIGVSGEVFCAKLVDQRLLDLVGTTEAEAVARVRFTEGLIRYDVRFEPHADSAGENLLVAVNGHQVVASQESLASKLGTDRIQSFRDFIERLHRRIADLGKKT